MCKSALIFSIFFIHTFFCFGQHQKHITDFNNNEFLINAITGIYIIDMEGNELASYNKGTAITPASTIKIITTATALELLGKNYRFKTELVAANENKLVIRGYGDPTLGSEFTNRNEKDFTTKWKEQIIKKFGNKTLEIEIDDSYFGYNGISNKWLVEDIGNYYAPGSYGISVYDNTYKLFLSVKNGSKLPEADRTEPVIPGLFFTNRLTVNSEGKDNAYIFGEPFSNNRLLTGSIPAGKTSFNWKGDIPDPGYYLGTVIAKELLPEINVTNVYTRRTKKVNEEVNGETFHTHYSVPLTDIIRIINYRSNNHYAEHVLRAIGRTSNNTNDAMTEGIDRILRFWESKGLDTGSLFIYDACGIAPSNAVSPEFLCEVLRYMHVSKNSGSFTASLPEAGKEGTVRNFLKDHKLPGKFLVKSGSIGNVQCYSGYYINGEKKYAFAVMVNNFKKDSRKQTVKAIETLLKDIF